MFVEAVARAREAICAVARVRRQASGTPRLDVTGTAWAAGTPSTFVTASHVVTPRTTDDRWYILRRIDAASTKLHVWPVAEVLLDDVDLDVAVLRVPASPVKEPIPLHLEEVPDGTRVLTFGCPSAKIQNGVLTAQGELLEASAFLAPFANEGIVSGHYEVSTEDAPPRRLGNLYEFNVSWLNGESGGAVIRVDPFGAFALMQSYRRIPTPVGDVPGPRRGFALTALGPQLRSLGMVPAGD
jgi:hypothetical protein